MKDSLQKIKDETDNYLNTIYAIVGFMHIYKYELKQSKNINVKLSQGRKFNKANDPENFVTPDLAILIDEKSGVIGEVKNLFPKDQSLWINDFNQLLSYDDILIGWPIKGEIITGFDIVLLVNDARSRLVRDYYLSKSNDEIKFKHPFIIIEYGRVTEAKQYFRFRIEHGTLSEPKIHKKLYSDCRVHWDENIIAFSKIKIYDSPPPLSLMLDLIYQCMFNKATAEAKYHILHKKTKINLETSIDEVTNLLYETYSFHSFLADYQERQPKFPKKEWVKKAVEKLISINEARWKDQSKGEFIFDLQKLGDDAIKYYQEKCLNEENSFNQLELF